MTEAQWLVCNDPIPMLEHVQGQASEGGVRWFAWACCLGRSHLLERNGLISTMEDWESYGDGQLDEKAREAPFDHALWTYCQDWHDLPAVVSGSSGRDCNNFFLLPSDTARTAAEAP